MRGIFKLMSKQKGRIDVVVKNAGPGGEAGASRGTGEANDFSTLV